jgi:ABC-type taurine transport system substrate-binding protein
VIGLLPTLGAKRAASTATFLLTGKIENSATLLPAAQVTIQDLAQLLGSLIAADFLSVYEEPRR